MVKKAIRAVRLNEEDDARFLKIHQRYADDFTKAMKEAGLSDQREWTPADTLTKLIREKHAQIEDQEQSVKQG